MEDAMKRLYEVIQNKNHDLIEEYGGDMDCFYDPEWAEFEGIPQVTIKDENVLEMFLSNTNYDSELATKWLAEYLETTICIDLKSVTEFLTNK